MASVSAAERQQKRKALALLKENGKYDHYKKKKCSLHQKVQRGKEKFVESREVKINIREKAERKATTTETGKNYVNNALQT